jgi:hypothetical protein
MSFPRKRESMDPRLERSGMTTNSMKLLNLKDNAIFLRHWREQMRPAVFGSALLLVFVIILIIFVNDFFKENYIYQYFPKQGGDGYQMDSRKIIVAWPNQFVWDLAVFQGWIVLLFGSIAAYRGAHSERVYGTLDFHRNSPTSRVDQMVGFLFGSTSLIWILFSICFLLQLAVVLAYHLSLLALFKFTVALLSSGILFHAICLLIGININPKSNVAVRIAIAIVLYWSITLVTVMGLSGFYHLSPVPSYADLSQTLRGAEGGYGYSYREREMLCHFFFGYRVHTLFFQLFTQFPLICLLLAGIKRNLTSNEQPVFSKSHTLLLTIFVMFLMTGSFVSHVVIPKTFQNGYYSRYDQSYDYLFGMVYTFLMGLGIAGALLVTPTFLMFRKGLYRMKKFNLKRLPFDDHQTSNLRWLIVFCFISGVFYIFNTMILFGTKDILLIKLGLLLSYIVFFASFLEYFRLSRYHKNFIVFGAIMIVFWVLLPILASVLESTHMMGKPVYLACLSPFYGGITILTRNEIHLSDIYIAFSVNAVMALIAIVLAHRQRIRLRQETTL